jgi:hypothetical protein
MSTAGYRRAVQELLLLQEAAATTTTTHGGGGAPSLQWMHPDTMRSIATKMAIQGWRSARRASGMSESRLMAELGLSELEAEVLIHFFEHQPPPPPPVAPAAAAALAPAPAPVEQPPVSLLRRQLQQIGMLNRFENIEIEQALLNANQTTLVGLRQYTVRDLWWRLRLRHSLAQRLVEHLQACSAPLVG